MECERKNNYREDKTVSGKKFQCEGASRCIRRSAGTRRSGGGSQANLERSKRRGGRKIFETFGSNDMSLLVSEWSRWDKYKRAPWRQGSSASARDGW